jgi:hypothetical protein
MDGHCTWYFAWIRDKAGLIREVPVQAENTFMAQKAALALHPSGRVVRIALAPPDWDGEDR